MFLHEARVGAGLAHRNIAHTYDVTQSRDGDYVIVMEYVRGASVQKVLRALRARGARMPIPVAVAVASEVCEAIDYAYNSTGPDGEPMHVVHRDISPSNVLISLDGHVKLLDFGIAKTSAHVELTKAGNIKGKYGYMAPEQLRGETVDCRTDIFSLGAVLYEMTTGRRPFRGQNEAQQIAALLMDPIPPPSQGLPDYPAELEHIVMRALSRDRLQRFQSPRELADELERCAGQHDWTMKSMSMSAFVKSVVGADIPEPTSAPSLPPVASGSRPAVSGTRPAASGTPGPHALTAPTLDADIPVVVEPAAKPAGARPGWVLPLTVILGVLVASVLFWVLVYPLMLS